MGRLPDTPEDQAAKGYPGKRRKKIDRLIADAEDRARRLAALPGVTDDLLSPPAMIHDPLFADALWIWQRYAGQLHELNLFGELDRLTFAMYCVYQAEFFQAAREVAVNGHERLVKTVSGDKMWRRNLAVDRRDAAAKMALDLSSKFGLTPLDLAALEKMHSAARDPGGLFGGQRRAPEEPAGEGAQESLPPVPAAEEDAIGLLDRLDSAPPGQRPN